MEIKINIEKKHFYVLSILMSALIVTVLVIAQGATPAVPNPGHSASTVGPGTFFGTQMDSYIFPGFLETKYLTINQQGGVEGGEIKLKGDGLNPDWILDVASGKFRISSLVSEILTINNNNQVSVKELCLNSDCKDYWPATEVAVGSGVILNEEYVPLPHYRDGTAATLSQCHIIVSPQLTGEIKIGSNVDSRTQRVYAYSDSLGKVYIGITDTYTNNHASCPYYIRTLISGTYRCNGDAIKTANYLIICTR